MSGLPTRPHSNAGRAAATLRLLWRHQLPAFSTPGPRASVSVDRIVDEAVRLADADGLPGVTMRRLAQRLGLSAMTLYSHVPGKPELLDLMLDAVCAAVERPSFAGLPWRDRLAAVAHADLDLHRRHPWLLDVGTTRPTLGPGAIGRYDHQLGALADVGLSDEAKDAVLTLVLQVAEGAARLHRDRAEAARVSGMDDEGWWSAVAPLLADLRLPERFPTASRTGTAVGSRQGAAYDPDHAFAFGLAVVLDGVSLLVDDPKRAARPGGVPG